MKKIKLKIQYNGTKFNGWQTQPKGRTVQGELEEVLSSLLSEKIQLFASGRTDAGVHAIEQVAHFETNSDFPVEKIPMALNATLSEDIMILEAEEISVDFHARFDVKQKTYVYKIYLSRIRKPLKHNLAVQIAHELNFDKIKKAIEILQGTHNYKAFCATNTSVTNFVRTIYSINIRKVEDEIWFEFTGNGFLYKMVRTLMGTLIAIGTSKLSLEDVRKMLDAQVRNPKAKTMPPEGLYLQKVYY